jgi:hypothetical protein
MDRREWPWLLRTIWVPPNKCQAIREQCSGIECGGWHFGSASLKHPLRLRPEHNLASPAPTASAPSVTGILQAWCVDGKESTHVDQTHSIFHWTSEALLFGWSSLCTIHVTLSQCLFLRLMQNQNGWKVCVWMFICIYIQYIYTYIYSICICVYSIYQCILYMYIVCQYVHMCWSCPIVVVSIYNATSKK